MSQALSTPIWLIQNPKLKMYFSLKAGETKTESFSLYLILHHKVKKNPSMINIYNDKEQVQVPREAHILKWFPQRVKWLTDLTRRRWHMPDQSSEHLNPRPHIPDVLFYVLLEPHRGTLQICGQTASLRLLPLGGRCTWWKSTTHWNAVLCAL